MEQFIYCHTLHVEKPTSLVTSLNEVFQEYQTICFTDESKLNGRIGLACVIYEEGVEKAIVEILAIIERTSWPRNEPFDVCAVVPLALERTVSARNPNSGLTPAKLCGLKSFSNHLSTAKMYRSLKDGITFQDGDPFNRRSSDLFSVWFHNSSKRSSSKA
ncbi:hypothetical protein TNCV_4376811 [Trichonephila clavipes]|nr:hypothetical protein TNCV_4376811 [Trichonephila clavipes]